MSNPQYKAIITGATGGIGQAIAKALAPHCQMLILQGRDTQKLAALKASLASSNTQVEVLAGDIPNPDTPKQLFDLAESKGGLNLLINNAGISRFQSFEHQSKDDIGHLLQTNLVAPILLTQSLLPLLKKEPSQIVNVGSIFGYLGFPGFSSYCASKFGLRGFSQALRRELSDTSVSVKYFSPRATQTSINTDSVVQMNQELGTQSDTPEWVAQEFIRFLSSNAWEKKLGFKESFFVLLNHLFPKLPDQGIGKQLPIIKKYLSK